MQPVGRTPRQVIDKLYVEIAKALRTADVRQQLTSLGLEPVGNTPAQFGSKIRAEIAQWAQVVKRAGIRPE